MKIINSFITILKHIPLIMALLIFYTYGFLWSIKPRKIDNMMELFKVFYYDFLRLEKKDVEIIKLSDKELITISRNPCPILKLSLALGIDTRYSCRLVSETVCRYVLKHINPDLVFERDYSYIRPYKDGCLEKIYLNTS